MKLFLVSIVMFAVVSGVHVGGAQRSYTNEIRQHGTTQRVNWIGAYSAVADVLAEATR